MGYRRTPVYRFDNKDATGIDKIPEGSMIIVKDYNGSSKQFVKETGGVSIDSAATIGSLEETGLVKTVGKQELDTIKNEAQAKQMLIDDIKFNGYGYTKRVPKKDRWLETDVPNTIVDKVLDPVRFSDGLVDRTDGNVVLPAAPFAPNTTDELLDYSVNGVETQVDHKVGDIVHCGNGEELITDSNLEGSLTPNDETIAFDGTTYVGIKYSIEVEVSGATAGVASLAGTAISTDGRYSIVSTEVIELIADADYDGTVVINTIKMIEQTYQCTTDTPAGTLVTSSEYQPIDYVTRTDVILLAKDGYKTFKGTKYFGPQASNKEIAEAYGFTWNKGLCEVSNLEVVNSSGELEVISGEVIVSGLVPRLNKKNYHPVFNTTGVNKVEGDETDGRFWYEDDSNTNLLKSTYSCISTQVAISNAGIEAGSVIEGWSPTGRPDNKYYDKIYFDGLGGVRSKLPYAIKPNLTDLLKEQEQLLIGVDDDAESAGVECVGTLVKGTDIIYGTETYMNILDGIVFGSIGNNKTDTIIHGYVLGSGGIPYVISYIEYVDNTRSIVHLRSEYGDVRNLFSDKSEVYILKQNKALTTAGTSTSIDVIGSPAKYTLEDSTYFNDGDNDVPLTSEVTDTKTALRNNVLSWNVDQSKLYRCVNMYDINDATSSDHTTDSTSTDLDTDDLVWNIGNSTMYKFVADDETGVDLSAETYPDTDRWDVAYRDNADLTAEDYSNTNKWGYVIGRYTNSWHTRLDEGNTLANVLLVSDSGDNLLPDGIRTRFKVSGKATDVQQVLVGSNSCSSWATARFTVDSVSNEVVMDIAPTANQVVVMSYEALAKPVVQSDPKPIIQAPTKVIGQSSHSPYQGGMLTAAATGKIATNDGKGLVSKVVEDCEIGYTVDSTNTQFGSKGGIPLAYGSFVIGNSNRGTNAKDGVVYKWVYTDMYMSSIEEDYLGFTDYSNIALWEITTNINTIPHHGIIDLSSSDSPASKSIVTLALDEDEYVVQVMSEELVNDDSIDDSIVTYTAGDDEITVSSGSLIKFAGFDNTKVNDVMLQLTEDVTFNYAAADLDGYSVLNSILTNGSSTLNGIKVWDGNFLGDSMEFNQLTNGTRLDDNANTVRTYVGIKRTGLFKGDN